MYSAFLRRACEVLHIIISAWGLRLLVSTIMGKFLGPQAVERATDTGLHAFLVYQKTILNSNQPCQEIARHKQRERKRADACSVS